MVYIDKNSKIVCFTRHSDDIKFTKLRFENQVTHAVFELTEFNYTDDSKLLYNIDITPVIHLFEVGQYDFDFLFGDDIVSSGILQFGDYQTDEISYENKVDYIQYTPN